ncbi:MAG: NAD(P)H-hydrate dehydratase [Planctomycetota bacterium]|nr:MAG: NAD(P)H-hydrate dehydratase [Planctomycetota bacterium]
MKQLPSPTVNSLLHLPPPILPASSTALVDACVQRMGTDLWHLMQQAGRALAAAVQQHYPQGRVLIACGPGNNGGDGLIAAATLAQQSRDVAVIMARDASSPLAQKAWQVAQEVHVPLITHLSHYRANVIVDALLGAGQQGPLRDSLRPLCRAINQSGIPVLACDIPTGGEDRDAITAQRVLSLQYAKQENRAATMIEDVADIGIPDTCYVHTQEECVLHFPRYLAGSHKGSNGRAVVVAGGAYPGASVIAADFACASGCDLVYRWSAGSALQRPHIIHHHQSHSHLLPDSSGLLQQWISRANAVLIGPGLGEAPESDEAARQALNWAREHHIPCVVDADGLRACHELIHAWGLEDPPLILTPHAGEARRLLGEAVSWHSLHAFAHRRRIIIAKGQQDFISDGQQWLINPRGNPRLAQGGSGDALAGLLTGLVARGCAPMQAAHIATWWLCSAADHCWQERGPMYLPEDIHAALAQTLRAPLQRLGMWPPG